MGGFEQVADPELYIRWCQFGMFSPIAHLFGMEHPNYKEPWNYGAEAQAIFTRYDELRYRLIPYIYSAFYAAYKTGKPVIRAMVFEYPEDMNTWSIDDQYFFGDDLLICPVTDKGARSRTLYLPEGKWIDYWSGEIFTGKRNIITKTPLEKLPIFVKAGAIIPMQPDMKYFGEKPVDPVTLNIYPSGNSSAKLYEDDGLTLQYQKGEFALTEITCEEDSQRVNLKIAASYGKYPVADRNYSLNIHLREKPASVRLNGSEVSETSGEKNPGKWSYDRIKGGVELTAIKKAGEIVRVEITK